jgi:hypothetical protein
VHVVARSYEVGGRPSGFEEHRWDVVVDGLPRTIVVNRLLQAAWYGQWRDPADDNARGAWIRVGYPEQGFARVVFELAEVVADPRAAERAIGLGGGCDRGFMIRPAAIADLRALSRRVPSDLTLVSFLTAAVREAHLPGAFVPAHATDQRLTGWPGLGESTGVELESAHGAPIPIAVVRPGERPEVLAVGMDPENALTRAYARASAVGRHPQIAGRVADRLSSDIDLRGDYRCYQVHADDGCIWCLHVHFGGDGVVILGWGPKDDPIVEQQVEHARGVWM